jgi:hypothetical protein
LGLTSPLRDSPGFAPGSPLDTTTSCGIREDRPQYIAVDPQPQRIFSTALLATTLLATNATAAACAAFRQDEAGCAAARAASDLDDDFAEVLRGF